MDAEIAFLHALVAGLLYTQVATLRLLSKCRQHATDYGERISGESVDIGLRMEEVCRIGSDIADTLEAIIDSGVLTSAATTTVADGEVDLKTTMASLLLSRLMGSTDGRTPEQEGSIYGTNQTQNQSTSTQDDNPPEE